jgi:hypothetical protein
VYIMTNLSCFALYFYKFRDEFKVFSHLIVPILPRSRCSRRWRPR